MKTQFTPDEALQEIKQKLHDQELAELLDSPRVQYAIVRYIDAGLKHAKSVHSPSQAGLQSIANGDLKEVVHGLALSIHRAQGGTRMRLDINDPAYRATQKIIPVLAEITHEYDFVLTHDNQTLADYLDISRDEANRFRLKSSSEKNGQENSR